MSTGSGLSFGSQDTSGGGPGGGGVGLRDGQDRARTDQSFCVPKADIAANDYDLSLNRYKEVVHDEVEYPAPGTILEELTALEEEIQKGLDELKAMLG